VIELPSGQSQAPPRQGPPEPEAISDICDTHVAFVADVPTTPAVGDLIISDTALPLDCQGQSRASRSSSSWIETYSLS